MTLKHAAGHAGRALIALLVVALGWAVAPATASAAPTAVQDPVVLTYDTSRAAEFIEAVDNGAAIWNESVSNVRLEPAAAGEPANIEIIADDGWPRTQTITLGNGTVWMGRQAIVDEGYDEVRVAAHELGHILGLPDLKPGPCSSLMSGSTAGPECTNPYPDEQEKAAVEANFASLATGAAPAASATRLHRD